MRLQYNQDAQCWYVIDERGKLGKIWNQEAASEFEKMMLKAEDLGECLPDVVDTLEEKEVDVDSLDKENEELRDEVDRLKRKIDDLQDFIVRIFEEVECARSDYDENLSEREEL